MQRFPVVFSWLILLLTTVAMAQKAEVALTVGASTVSDVHLTFTCPPAVLCLVVGGQETIKTDHQVFFEGTGALRLVNAKVASIYLELPIAGIPHQTVTFSGVPPASTSTSHLSSLYITPSFKAKLLPGAPISPWVSVGGGWAHFSFPHDFTNKGALQFGGGVDVKTPLPHFDFRLEVRDFLSGQPSFGTPGVGLLGNAEGGLSRHNVLAGGGFVVRF